jgi:hypothetical protein
MSHATLNLERESYQIKRFSLPALYATSSLACFGSNVGQLGGCFIDVKSLGRSG